MDVGTGQVTGLVGANGAGKSTTLGAIAGIKSISTGSVTLDGESIVGLAPERIVRAGIALVPENRRIFSSLSVSENLMLGAGPTRHGADDLTRDKVTEVLDWFPILRTYAKRSAGTLSGGEQQQLAIARALVTRPKLLMLDEPSLGLAPRIVDSVFDLLEELKAAGQTILLVEQNVRRTLHFADRSYVLRGGRVSLEGTKKEFAEMENMRIEEAFFGDERTPTRGAQRTDQL